MKFLIVKSSAIPICVPLGSKYSLQDPQKGKKKSVQKHHTKTEIYVLNFTKYDSMWTIDYRYISKDLTVGEMF